MSHAAKAAFLREVSGSNSLEHTLSKAVKVLAKFDIPHYVCGGFAVQERGYPRFTEDVDIIVPDVQAAREKLCMNGFREVAGTKMTITDRETRVRIDLLPGAGKVGPGPLSFPMPHRVSNEPQILTLGDLISLKLSSHIGSGISRIQDLADVVELIKANHLARGFPIHAMVRDAYRKVWDELHPSEAPAGGRTSI